MPAELAARIDYENLRATIRNKVNNKFNRLRDRRINIEQNWVQIHNAIQEGCFLADDLREIVGRYVDQRDNTYATMVAQELAQKLAYVKADGFQLKPKPYSAGTGELVRTDAIEKYLKDKFKSENCKWDSSWHDALYQHVAFNFGILHYSFTFKKEPKYKQQYKLQDGAITLDCYQEESELTYQGAVLNYVNLFNFYIDSVDHNFSDLYALDTFYREARNFSDVLADPTFDPKKPYIHEGFVIYRDNESIKELTSPTYAKSWAETALDSSSAQQQEAGGGNSQNNILKSYLDVRTCYLSVLKMVDKEGKDLELRDICVIYGTNNDEVYPLLVEFNPRPFNQKPYVYLSGFKNGITVYGSSHVGRAYSEHARSAFSSALESYTAGDAVFGTKFIDMNFLASYPGSRSQFEEALKSPGFSEYLDTKKYLQEGGGSPQTIFMSPQRQWAMESLPVLREMKNTARGDMQNSLSQLASGAVSESTAAGVKYQATQQNLFQEHFKKIVADAMRRIIALNIDDYKKLKAILRPETIMTELDSDEIQSLMSDLSSGKLSESDDGNIYKQDMLNTEQGPTPIVSGINLYTRQKFMTLMPWFWDQLDVGVDIKIDGVDIDKAFEQENITKLFDLAEKYQVPALMSLATEMFLTNMDVPNTDKILAEMQQQMQQQQQPDPMEQQAQMEAMENQRRATEAKVFESEARAANLQATADQKNIENELVLQQEQARQMILGQAAIPQEMPLAPGAGALAGV